MVEIKYINRKTNRQEIEKVPGGGSMSFIYGNPIGRFSLWVLVKRKFFSAWFGKYMNSRSSAKKIEPFIANHQIDMGEYLIPENGFQNFNDFFFRKVKPTCRPISEGVVSPADGRVLVFDTLKEAHKFFVKGKEFDLSTFLGNSELTRTYEKGAMCIIRLAPVDYHRYHFPVSGKASASKKINGYYYSVSPIALRKNMKIFWENKREYTIVESSEFGKVLICDVGATLTGGIQQTYKPNSEVRKGDEKGYFYFGGSTLILLFEEGKITFSSDLIRNTDNGLETLLKMGETIGSLRT